MVKCSGSVCGFIVKLISKYFFQHRWKKFFVQVGSLGGEWWSCRACIRVYRAWCGPKKGCYVSSRYRACLLVYRAWSIILCLRVLLYKWWKKVMFPHVYSGEWWSCRTCICVYRAWCGPKKGCHVSSRYRACILVYRAWSIILHLRGCLVRVKFLDGKRKSCILAYRACIHVYRAWCGPKKVVMYPHVIEHVSSCIEHGL